MSTAAAEPSFGQTVVIGGAGAMGRLLCEALSCQVTQLIVVDRETRTGTLPADAAYLQADLETQSAAVREVLADADLAILALPEAAAVSTVPLIVSSLPPKALLVDTLSVKIPFADALLAEHPAFEALSINPMFAPSLGFAGQNVVAVELNPGLLTSRFRSWLEALGARLTTLGVEEHDRAAASLQTATHAAILAFGLALQRLGYDIGTLSQIAPPPHRTLLALLARILSGAPEVYWDIQTSNSFAAEARHKLQEGLQHLDDAARRKDLPAFRALLEDMRGVVGSEQDALARLCTQMFDRQRQGE